MKGELSLLGRKDKEKYIYEYTFQPGNWFVKDYFLFIQTAWFNHVCHVGDVDYDITKPIKVTIEVPLDLHT